MSKTLIQDFIKRILRKFYRIISSNKIYRSIFHHPRSLHELHQYWMNPSDKNNLPKDYLMGRERSQFLIKIIEKYLDVDANILEIGCNVGRNLNHLFQAGFKNLHGIEINEEAVQLLKQFYPEMAGHIKIDNAAIEDVIREDRDSEFDAVFTMAVLQHIHKDSEWVFSYIVRITKSYLITIENEHFLSWRSFPRNYKKVFESLGMKQIEEYNCDKVGGLGSNFNARIFKK